MRILLVADERKMIAYLCKGFSEHGFVVDVALQGHDGIHLALTGSYALVVLDVMLPQRDGWSVLQALRQSGSWTPVLFLTARDTVADRVKGLNLGADDYVVKPFAFAELLARMRTILRRAPPVRRTAGCGYRNRSRAPSSPARRNSSQPDPERVRVVVPSYAARRRGPVADPDCGAGLGHELSQRHKRRGCGDSSATGGGIAPEHLPKLFDRFYGGDPARRRDSQGTGLGLAIVQSIMMLHGGTVAIESIPAVGTTVWLRFPPIVAGSR